MAAIPIATSVAPSDTSTSIVITPTGPQIESGKLEAQMRNDVVYSQPQAAGYETVALKMDVLVPKSAGKKPLVVWYPGGGFVHADKSGSLDHKTYVAEAGYAVASVEYRTILAGATYVQGVADAKSAIRYLRAHADEYGIDIEKVAVWGESVGGYLAAMVGTTNGTGEFDIGDNLDQSSDVQAVIDQFGPSDLPRMGADFDEAFEKEIAAPGSSAAQWVFGPGTTRSVDDNPEEVARANPITYVNPTDPPFALFHGTDDTLVSPSQTLMLHNALRAKGVDSTRYVIAGARHGDMSFLGDADAVVPWSTQTVMNLLISFLDKHLKG